MTKNKKKRRLSGKNKRQCVMNDKDMKKFEGKVHNLLLFYTTMNLYYTSLLQIDNL